MERMLRSKDAIVDLFYYCNLYRVRQECKIKSQSSETSCAMCNCAESKSKNNSAPFSTSSKFKSHQNRKLLQSQRRWWMLWAQSWASTSSLGGKFLALQLQIDISPIAPSIVAELIVVFPFSVGVQACSGLTPGCTLNQVSHIFQVVIYCLSSLFAFIAALFPPS